MPRYSVVTFGCQMNQHDSDRIGEVLEAAGYDRALDIESADLVLFNGCSVREKAVQKLRSDVGRIARLKREKPALIVGVAGCFAQQEGEAIVRRMPYVDLVVGPDNIPEIPRLLTEIDLGGVPRVRTEFDLDDPQFLSARPSAGGSVTAFVTTMKGCDERCSFCIVPSTRGPERYRPSAEIVDEIERLVASGVKEVTLLGQTVDSWTEPAHLPLRDDFRSQKPRPRGDESEFPWLLRRIAERVTGLARLRYTSPHPRHLTAALVEAHRDLPVLARHVHMPVQSGSDRVLKRMIRRYTTAEYVERTSALMRVVPGLTLSTDIIVGFPGETRRDFEATLELVRRVGFVSVFGFMYSRRPGTPALALEDDVPEAEKSERLAALFEVSEAQRRAHLSTLVGSRAEVLVEGATRANTLSGRTSRNEIVHFESAEDLAGVLAEVEIVEAYKHSLRGALLSPVSPRARVGARVEAGPAGPRTVSRSLPVV